MKTKTIYDSPVLDEVLISVEHGFAESNAESFSIYPPDFYEGEAF